MKEEKGSGSQALGQLFPAGSVYTIDHKSPINYKANQVKPIKFAGISYIFCHTKCEEFAVVLRVSVYLDNCMIKTVIKSKSTLMASGR